MKKQKKYTEPIVSTEGRCAKEPATEYQVMRKQLPPQVMISIGISETQIARGEAVDYKIVIEQLQKKVGL